jgi:DNA-binding transcriptional MerR regulator
MRIGDVAARSGVSVDTIRLYEQRGILAPAERSAAGYRLYDSGVLRRIHLARALADLGLTLGEIAAALAAHDPASGCSTDLWRLEAVRDRVRTRIGELRQLATELDAVISGCGAGECRLGASAAEGVDQKGSLGTYPPQTSRSALATSPPVARKRRASRIG